MRDCSILFIIILADISLLLILIRFSLDKSSQNGWIKEGQEGRRRKKIQSKVNSKETNHVFRCLLGSQRTKREDIFSQKRLLENSLSLKTTESPFQNQGPTVLTLQTQISLTLQFMRTGFSEAEGLTGPTHMTQLTKISKPQLSKPGRIQRISSITTFARKLQARLEKSLITQSRSRPITAWLQKRMKMYTMVTSLVMKKTKMKSKKFSVSLLAGTSSGRSTMNIFWSSRAQARKTTSFRARQTKLPNFWKSTCTKTHSPLSSTSKRIRIDLEKYVSDKDTDQSRNKKWWNAQRYPAC